MKRKSTLILIAALVLTVSIPLFAFAETVLGTQPADGTGFMNGRGGIAAIDANVYDALGHQYALTNGYSVDADGTCYYLDANGTVQRLFTRNADGQMTALQAGNGALCWALDDDEDTIAPATMMSRFADEDSAVGAYGMNSRFTQDTDTSTVTTNRRFTDDDDSSFGGMGRGRWN